MLRLATVSAVLFVLTGACGSAPFGGGDDDADAATDAGNSPAADADPDRRPRNELLIRGDEFPKLVLEVDAVAGFEPRSSVEADLIAGFEPILDKPAGIEIVRDGVIASRGSDHAWTFEELDTLANATFDADVGDDAIKVHVLFVDGHSARDDEGNGTILGLAWSHTNIAMFEQTIESTCAGAIITGALREQLCAGAELAIWTHELGHNLGLVDNGLAMVTDHRDPDPEHGAHDQDDACVMFFAYESEAVFDVITADLLGGGDAELGFDDECLADIAAVRDGP